MMQLGFAQTNDGRWIPVYQAIQAYQGGRGYVYRKYAVCFHPEAGTRLVLDAATLRRLSAAGRLRKHRPATVDSAHSKAAA